MKRVLALRHVAFEDLGLFERPLLDDGYSITYVEAPTHDLCAVDVISPDLLVVLGGPIGVYEEAAYPFLTRELALIRQRLDSGRALLGICLGAQLVAHACGAAVYAGPAREIGWAPVTLTDAGTASPLAPLADGEPVLHWHGDTFDLPRGAIGLASTSAYPQQAFAIGTQVLALQFHLETSQVGIERWLVGHAVELSNAGVDLAGLRAGACAVDIRRRVLRAWLAGVAFD